MEGKLFSLYNYITGEFAQKWNVMTENKYETQDDYDTAGYY